MAELWDVYDCNKRKTGRTVVRGVDILKEGEYHMVVHAIIINSKNELLISKRAQHKNYGLMWEFNGGSVLAGETNLEGMLREVKEELGIQFSAKDAIFFKETRREKLPPNFKQLWLFKKDVQDKEITLPDGETIDWKWVTIEEFNRMVNNGEVVPTIEFDEEDYKIALEKKQIESYSYIGKTVKAKIDRPLNSKHPKHGFIYPVNYGYLPNVISGDGEELDCYILGETNPVEEYEGDCIAVIHRTNDDDDKLIIVPKGKNYSDEEIRNLTAFQEQYFESEIIR